MRRRTETPAFRRRSLDYSPAQLTRQVAIGVELATLARNADGTAHRFAPDGTPLIRYAGTTWTERLASWMRR